MKTSELTSLATVSTVTTPPQVKSPLDGKIIWLTGASSGIGRALAIELARRGAKLALTSRDVQKLSAVVLEIKAQGGNAVALPADVKDLEQLKSAANQIPKEFAAPVDILIANAGTHIFTEPEKFDSQEYLTLMDINYGGMLRSIEAVIPEMIRNKHGHIVAVASLAGSRGLPRAGAYGASKAAMNNFLESIRFHLKRHGVQVTVVNPGFVKTPLTDKNDFAMPFLISAEKAATIIADGLEQRRKEISFPIPFNWIVKSARFLPGWLYEIIVDRLW